MFLIFLLGVLPERYRKLSVDRRETVSLMMERARKSVIEDQKMNQSRRESRSVYLNKTQPDAGSLNSLANCKGQHNNSHLL
jgi:hypothetical protein